MPSVPSNADAGAQRRRQLPCASPARRCPTRIPARARLHVRPPRHPAVRARRPPALGCGARNVSCKGRGHARCRPALRGARPWGSSPRRRDRGTQGPLPQGSAAPATRQRCRSAQGREGRSRCPQAAPAAIEAAVGLAAPAAALRRRSGRPFRTRPKPAGAAPPARRPSRLPPPGGAGSLSARARSAGSRARCPARPCVPPRRRRCRRRASA